MDESKKKPIMIGAIVVCLAVAGLITWRTASSPSGIKTIPAGQKTWMVCRNPECQHNYEISLRDYYKQVEAAWNAATASGGEAGLAPPPLTCPKCSEASCHKAYKCPSCSVVFEVGSVRGDLEDRCPKCNYSQLEANTKRAAGSRFDESR